MVSASFEGQDNVIDFVCPKPTTLPHKAFVKNNDGNDDDWAKVKVEQTRPSDTQGLPVYLNCEILPLA